MRRIACNDAGNSSARNVIVGTSLRVLLMNSSFAPPVNRLYGAKVKGFVVSKVHYFGGKPWQIRSIQVNGNDWHIIPFILNSGGVGENQAIISDPVLKHLGIDRCSVDVNTNHENVLLLPQPLRIMHRPL